MADPFSSFAPGLDSGGDLHFLITPGPADIDPRPRFLRCNVAGTATIEDRNGNPLTYSLVAGEYILFRGTKVTAVTGGCVLFGYI